MQPSWTRLLVSALLVVSLSACASEMSRQRRADANWKAVTTVSSPVGVIESPWDGRATAAWIHAVEQEALAVADLLDANLLPDLRVRLVPVTPAAPTGDPLRDGLRAHERNEGHVGGYFHPDDGLSGVIVLYVPEHEVSARIVLEDRMATLRHELAHAYGEALGWGDAPLWFSEGTARVIEELDGTDPRWDGLMPLAVLRAPVVDAREVIDDLLAWRPLRQAPADSWQAEADRYDQAGALVFFLLRHEEGPFDRRCRVVARIDDDELRATADAWALWLAPIDPYLDLARGLRHADVEVRRDAMLRLRRLAQDPSHWEILARLPHVELAVLLLDHPHTFRPAAAFLVDIAADRVSSEDVERLASSASEGQFLVGQALRARRGERPDSLAVAAVWAGIPAEERLARYGPVIGPLDLELGELSSLVLLPDDG